MTCNKTNECRVIYTKDKADGQQMQVQVDVADETAMRSSVRHQTKRRRKQTGDETERTKTRSRSRMLVPETKRRGHAQRMSYDKAHGQSLWTSADAYIMTTERSSVNES